MAQSVAGGLLDKVAGGDAIVGNCNYLGVASYPAKQTKTGKGTTYSRAD